MEKRISWIIENSHNICTFFSVFLLYMYMGTHIIYKSCSNYILLGQGCYITGRVFSAPLQQKTEGCVFKNRETFLLNMHHSTEKHFCLQINCQYHLKLFELCVLSISIYQCITYHFFSNMYQSLRLTCPMNQLWCLAICHFVYPSICPNATQ